MDMEQISNLHQSETVINKLASRGYTSSVHIYQESMTEFCRKVSDTIPEEEAVEIYCKAERNYALLTHMVTAFMTASPEHGNSVGDGESEKSFRFEGIPNYQELFGKLDYCSCPKCKSVFGAAAYFVDLMRIIGKHIILEDRTWVMPRPVPLKTRRSDLWEMKLSCENTNKELPYIQIVNRILEGYNEQERLSNESGDIYKAISQSHYPHTPPFSLPLEKIRLWLDRQKLSTEVFMGQWGTDRKALICESMKLSAELYDMLERPLSLQQLAKLMGLEKVNVEELKKTDVFLKRMQMNHTELYSLLEQDIDEHEEERVVHLQELFFNQGLSPQGYLEVKDGKITHLDEGSLERLVRFVRLSRVLQVTYSELDWMIKITGTQSHKGDISLEDIWEICRFARLLQIDILSATAFFAPIRDYGDNLYARIFGKTRKAMKEISEEHDKLRVLSTTLGTDIGNLYILRDYFGQDKEIIEDKYYRHISMARLLGIGLEEYTELLTLLFEEKQSIFTPKSAEKTLLFWKEKTIEFSVWRQILSLTKGKTEGLLVASEHLHTIIDSIRKYFINEERTNWRNCKEYVFERFADYFDIEATVLEQLFSFALTEKEMEHLTERVLFDEEYADLDSYFCGMYTWLLLYKSGIPEGLLYTVARYAQFFNVTSSRQLSITDVRTILKFYSYKEMWEDTHNQLNRFVEQYGEEDWNIMELISLTGWDKTQVEKLIQRFYVAAESEINRKPDIISFLDRISGAMYLVTKASLDVAQVDTILRIVDTAFTKYEVADELSSKLVDAFLNKKDWAALEALKRNVLLPVTLQKLNMIYSDITDYNMLYKYFLIDVEMDDKTQISLVKEGVNALQLYLQRCRMHLESGIKEITIPSSWWPWIMDYTEWEANRRLFVYPENYLLPSVRHSKTRLFCEVESALEQARITDGYMEEQYVKYLDAYFDLTQLKICGAYETTEEYYNILYVFARTKQQPYTYYFCRKQGTLSWSEWEKIDAPIDSETINPVYVFNRLHIFWSNVREKEKVKLGEGQTLSADNQRTYLLEIKYTYKNLQGKWITPQTIVENEVVYARETGEKFASSQKIADQLGIYRQPEAFQKLTLLKLTKKNLKGVPKKRDDYECLAIITGSFSESLEKSTSLLELDFKLDKELEVYTEKLNRIIGNSNYQVMNQEDGYLNTGFFRIFNEELEEEHFYQEKEFIVVDGYIPAKNSRIYHVLHDQIHHAVGAYLSQSVIYDSTKVTKGVLPFKNNAKPGTVNRPKLTKKSFVLFDAGERQAISPMLSEKIFNILKAQDIITEDDYVDERRLANSDLLESLGGLSEERKALQASGWILNVQDVLLKNAGAIYLFEKAEKAEIIPVVNQPGKFIYDCGDEAFLVYPVYEDKEKVIPVEFRKMDEGTHTGSTITSKIFVKMGIGSVAADQIVQALINTALIDRETRILDGDGCTRQRLGESLKDVELITQDREKLLDQIYGRLLNLPLIFKSQLIVVEGISAEDICMILQKEGILYRWDETQFIYRIDLRRMKEKTDVLFQNDEKGTVTEQALVTIYQKLSDQVSAIRMNYRLNRDLPEKYTDQLFCKWKFGVMRLTNPTIKKLKRKLEVGGIPAFLNRDTQSEPKNPIMPFLRLGPTDNVIPPKASDGAQVDFEGLYGEYNWELFYHIPMMIASNLSGGTQNEEGMKWLHYIFDPTKTPDEKLNKYYWNFYPFTNTQSESMDQMLTDPSALKAYNDSPFDPHAVARLRIDAYAKYTVMEYVSNLIQWGDMYFVRNTWEALTSATMMYVWAADLLGSKPEQVRAEVKKEDKNFREIEEFYANDPEGIPQFIIDLEKRISLLWKEGVDIPVNREVPYNDIRSYFGVPENEHIVQMWELVEDRLFKLRNSLDINGAPRITALFEPEKDPLALVKSAASSGPDVPGTLSRRFVNYPYRFQYIVTEAKAVTSGLMQLGVSLNNALEKQDAEALMELTTSQEQVILKMGISTRENQLEEVRKEIESIKLNRDSAKIRKDYYDRHVKEYISVKEQTSLELEDESAVLRALAGTTSFAAGVAHLLPQLGSPFAMKYGGMEIGASLHGVAAGYDTMAGILTHVSQQSLTLAQYDRRKEEWELQRDVSEKEVESMEAQLDASRLRERIAATELELQKKSLTHREEVLSFLKSKFTGTQLYQWLAGRIQSTMWQTYQLALELSVAAQEAYSYERDETADFLKFDYWDSGRKGLMAGEHLMLALQQMEQCYTKKNLRRLEIEKHISMAHCMSRAMEELKTKGICEFELGEWLFAADYPGAYRRKIVELCISVPAVLPPYETVKATLKQQKSYLLKTADAKGISYLFGLEKTAPGSVEDCRRYGEKIAVSKGIDDSGLFVLNFQDERYLPFEGTGVASNWILEMPPECNHFKLESISDIILSVRYTALEDEKRGSGSFYEQVLEALKKRERGETGEATCI